MLRDAKEQRKLFFLHFLILATRGIKKICGEPQLKESVMVCWKTQLHKRRDRRKERGVVHPDFFNCKDIFLTQRLPLKM